LYCGEQNEIFGCIGSDPGGVGRQQKEFVMAPLDMGSVLTPTTGVQPVS